MKVEVLDSISIDYEEMHSLLREAFAHRSKSNVDVEIPSPQSLEFKYQNSVSPSKLATVRCNGELVAMNGLIPIEICNSGFPTVGWMSCDTATHPNYQGRGLFKQCVSALEVSLPDGAFLFGFPNLNSMPGFTKMGWRRLAEVDLYFSSSLLGTNKSAIVKEVDINTLNNFPPNPNGIVKSREYLIWRYGPLRGDYEAHEISSETSIYFVISRKLKINGIVFSLVLDVLSENQLLAGKSLRKLCKVQNTLGLLLAPQIHSRLELGKNGFLQVPSFLVSRKIVLSGKCISYDADKSLTTSHWNLSLGDFDAL
jgi:hypothetical protein